MPLLFFSVKILLSTRFPCIHLQTNNLTLKKKLESSVIFHRILFQQRECFSRRAYVTADNLDKSLQKT